ncbi:PspC domain-containing protein, partial [Cellulomonas sp.]
LAARLNVDPLLVRGILAVTFLLGGLGLLLYGVAWALLPEQRDGRIHLERLVAGDGDVALLGALAFVLVGLARGDGWWWFWDGTGWFSGLLWLAFVGGLVALVVLAVRRRPRGPVPPGAWTHTGPTAGAPYAPPYTPPYPAAGAPAAPAAPAWAAPTAPGERVTAPAPPHPAGGWTPPPAPPVGGWAAPPVPPVPPAPPLPPRPARPPRKGADAATVGVVVGLSVLGLAVLLLGERTGTFDGPVGLTAGGVALVLAGLGIVTLGLRGRTSGVVGFLAVVAALVWVPLALVTQADREDWWGSPAEFRGERIDAVITARDEAQRGFDLGVGTGTVDLTGVPLEGGPLHVPLSLGAGDLTVVVPTDAAVEARVSAGVGSVVWELDGERRSQDGVGIGDMTFRDQDASAGEPDLVLDISSGVGEVRIIEEDAA